MSDAPDPLIRQLKAWQPRTLITVGDAATALVSAYANASPGCAVDALRTDDAADRILSIKSARRYDFGLVAGFLEQVDKVRGGAVIARLRDVLVRRLCVIVESGDQPDWPDEELIAYGLTLLAELESERGGARLFGFDIATYKQTPDWLNPRHWAHPELWGKYRW